MATFVHGPGDAIAVLPGAAGSGLDDASPPGERYFRHPGDLVRLLSRTGEALRQLANLRDANPTAASIADTASRSILREPVR